MPITFTPLKASAMQNISKSRNEVAIATPIVISGATSAAIPSLESTVMLSEIGSDFQNRMLRSRRSSYKVLRQ